MKLRDEQKTIAEYTGGLAAVSAVPGSGKTFTLAMLAAQLLASTRLPDDGEVLVVTFTNSAVDNIRSRIRAVLKERGLIDVGYRVLTLHGLASLIVRERPDLAGTTADFRLDDEITGPQSMSAAARLYIAQNSDYWQSFLSTSVTAQQRLSVEQDWTRATEQIGREVTRLAKNLRLRPAELKKLMGSGAEETLRGSRGDGEQEITSVSSSPFHLFTPSPFLQMGVAIYERYEKILSLGGRLDFDDLIWRAIMALENDDGFRSRLGRRWPFILEDEAQDSTPLQQKILSMLSADHNNWVRVGDPNQAIMTTFTASDVRFFREFMTRADVTEMPLSVSGRSAPKIIALANRLADWAALEQPEPEVRATALSNKVLIYPTGPGDEQPNPSDDDARIIVKGFADVETEAKEVAKSAINFVLAHPDRTCAILTPTNYFGRNVIDELTPLQAAHPNRVLFQDQLRNAQPVRNVARALTQAVRYCSLPTNTNALAELRKALVDIGASSNQQVTGERMTTLVRSLKPERLLFPSPAAEPALPETVAVGIHEQHELDSLAEHAAKWLKASMLPIDQLILVIAQGILKKESDLAIAHSLALSLRRLASINPQIQLADLARELDDVASNRQTFMSNSLSESGFEPIPGQVTMTTMHKAKGLEWDRVYLTNVDQYEFPHDVEGQYRGQLWYLNGRDPATEARKQLEALAAGETLPPGDIELIRRARIEYISERLRLLYVGITRAKRDLQMSYSRAHGRRTTDLALAARAIT